MIEMVTLISPSIRLQFKKVKSHQDRNNTNEPLISEEMNLKVDQLAAYIFSYEGPVRSCLETENKDIIITSSDSIPGIDLYEITLQQIGGKQLKQYLIDKCKWNKKTYELIN